MSVLFRLAWREIGRHKVRSLLVGILTLLPIAVVGTVVMMMPGFSGMENVRVLERAGYADAQLFNEEAAVLPFNENEELIEEIQSQLGPEDIVVESRRTTAYADFGFGSYTRIMVEEVDAGHAMMEPRFRLRDGRYPSQPNEALAEYISDETFARYNDDRPPVRRKQLGVGDSFELESQFSANDEPTTIEVVGTYERIEPCPMCNSIAVFPGTLSVEFYSGLFNEVMLEQQWFIQINGWTGSPTDMANLNTQVVDLPMRPWSDGAVSVDDPIDLRVQLLTLVMASFLLFWTGLVAACGYAVGLRRRRRELGLLAANGADPRQLKTASIAEAGVIGVCASLAGLIGSAIAALCMFTFVFHNEHSALEVMSGVGPFRLGVSHLVMLGGLIVLGTLSSMVAAWAATIGLSSQTPAELLAGRSRRPRPISLWLLSGGLLVIAGGVALQIGTGSSADDLNTWLIIGGLALAAIGVVPLVVSVIRLAGLFGKLGPLSMRIAARDLVRQGIRTGAAASAVCLTITVGVVVIVGLEPQEPSYYFDDEPRSSPDLTEEASESSIDRTGIPPSVYPRNDLLGVPGRWSQFQTEETSRHDNGLMQPRQMTESELAGLRDQGWTVSSILKVFSSDALQECESEDLLQFYCSAYVAVVDKPTMELMPDSVVQALKTHGYASLVGHGAVISTDDGDIELVHTPIAEDCQQCRLTHMGDFHSLIMTAEQASSFGFDVNHFLNTQMLNIRTDDHSETEVEALAESLADNGWNLWENYYGWMSPAESMDDANRLIRSLVITVVNFVSLFVVAISLALVRIESKSDDQVLVVSGSSPLMARWINSWRSLLIVVVATIPAVPLGIMVWVIALEETPIPWRWLSMLAISLLVLSPLVGALGARHTTKISAR